jgi:CheY-like chemotaxis protein
MTKVLYVEDHEAQRDIMMRMLELFGYEVDGHTHAGADRWPGSHPSIAQQP